MPAISSSLGRMLGGVLKKKKKKMWSLCREKKLPSALGTEQIETIMKQCV